MRLPAEEMRRNPRPARVRRANGAGFAIVVRLHFYTGGNHRIDGEVPIIEVRLGKIQLALNDGQSGYRLEVAEIESEDRIALFNSRDSDQ